MAPLTRTLLTASALVVLAACAKKAPEELPPAPVETARPSDATPAAATPAGPVKGSQEDFLASVAADKIYFDTDKYDVGLQGGRLVQERAHHHHQLGQGTPRSPGVRRKRLGAKPPRRDCDGAVRG